MDGGMKYWKVDRNKWLDEHPMPTGGFTTAEEAETWCVEIRKIHTDRFNPLILDSGRWTVEQDIP
jgi:hypothetical protein